MATNTPVPSPGLYVPVPTFFQPSSHSSASSYASPALDLKAQGAHAVYLARAGITGLVILGTTGEAVAVHPRERRVLIKGVRDALDAEGFKDYPLIAGTAAQCVEEVVEQLKDAKEAGAQFGMVLAPGYFAAAVGGEGLERWFSEVARESPVPILIYYFPGVSNGLKISPSTFEALAQNPKIVGCKLSHGDVSHHIQVASSPAIDPSQFRVFTGFGQQLAPVVAAGGAGAIDGSANFFPRSMVKLYQLASKDVVTVEEAKQRRELQYKISRMEEEMVVKLGTAGIKEAIRKLRGFGASEALRSPLVGSLAGGTDKTWEGLKAVIDAVEEVEKSA